MPHTHYDISLGVGAIEGMTGKELFAHLAEKLGHATFTFLDEMLTKEDQERWGIEERAVHFFRPGCHCVHCGPAGNHYVKKMDDDNDGDRELFCPDSAASSQWLLNREDGEDDSHVFLGSSEYGETSPFWERANTNEDFQWYCMRCGDWVRWKVAPGEKAAADTLAAADANKGKTPQQ